MTDQPTDVYRLKVLDDLWAKMQAVMKDDEAERYSPPASYHQVHGARLEMLMANPGASTVDDYEIQVLCETHGWCKVANDTGYCSECLKLV